MGIHQGIAADLRLIFLRFEALRDLQNQRGWVEFAGCIGEDSALSLCHRMAENNQGEAFLGHASLCFRRVRHPLHIGAKSSKQCGTRAEQIRILTNAKDRRH